MIEYNIATGLSRTALKWKNEKVTWESLVDRLSRPTRTPETMAEYDRMSRDEQSRVKDVGGFVGGYCHHGKRQNTVSRSLITLDADFADGDIWRDWMLGHSEAACVYSTHKHRPDAPRLRLIVPLSRDCDLEEYQAVARALAKDIGIEKFDDTTYQPQRLMYWPSVSLDGEFVFHQQNGEPLDVDRVLATYTDWHDVSAWPHSNRVAEIAHKSATSQADPLQKPGVIGAFCRAWPIRDAIAEFVPAYAPTGNGRYTYTQGTSFGGVVVYEEKFVFSNHNTDPASGQLCNAFDLVRLHRFGELDKGKSAEDGEKLPSYKAMIEFAAKDEATRRMMDAETLSDFDTLPMDAPLERNKDGSLTASIENAYKLITQDPDLQDVVGQDNFSLQIKIKKPLPWRRVERTPSNWTDADDAYLRARLEKKGFRSENCIKNAFAMVVSENAFHPVREYLRGLKWDGVRRLDRLLIDYLGAEDSAYTRAVTRKHMTAAVARIYEPGVKYDQVLCLQGTQGTGKSTLIGRLGGDWYSDSLPTMEASKEAYEAIAGVWILEIGELASMRKSESEAVKNFVSKRSDRYRPAYGHHQIEQPRQCVFWATTNEPTFLRDASGNRRFWVVRTPGISGAMVHEDITKPLVDQIWAEAVAAYKAGESLTLPPELESVARKIQDSYSDEDPMVGEIENYLQCLIPADKAAWFGKTSAERHIWASIPAEDKTGLVPQNEISAVEIWCDALGRPRDRLDRLAVKSVQAAMMRIGGWELTGQKSYRGSDYGSQRVWVRK